MIIELPADNLLLTRECAYAFFKESGMPGVFNYPHWLKQWETYIKNGFGVIFAEVRDNKLFGMLGGFCFPCNMTADVEIIEAFWYVMEPYRGKPFGIRLLHAFESWGRRNGAKRIKMIHLNNLNSEVMAAMYERMGYTPLEVAYIKPL